MSAKRLTNRVIRLSDKHVRRIDICDGAIQRIVNRCPEVASCILSLNPISYRIVSVRSIETKFVRRYNRTRPRIVRGRRKEPKWVHARNASVSRIVNGRVHIRKRRETRDRSASCIVNRRPSSTQRIGAGNATTVLVVTCGRNRSSWIGSRDPATS